MTLVNRGLEVLSARIGEGTRRGAWCAGFVVAAVICAGTAAHAQLAPQWDYCTGSSGVDWNTQIRNCTTLINSGRETRKNRSIAYINRGLAYYTLKNFDRAISDYSEAIGLDGESKIAYHNRGLAYKNSGSLDAAISDYSRAIRIDSRYASAYVARGNVYAIKGDQDRAIADYDAAIRYDPEVLVDRL